MADGALLALIASLGLLQLGHETTPELAQLAAVSLYLYGLAASDYRPLKGGLAVGLALPALAASGAPSIALLLAGVGLAVTLRRAGPAGPGRRRSSPPARRSRWSPPRCSAPGPTGSATTAMAASRLAAERDRLVRLADLAARDLHRVDLAAAAPRRASGDAARLHPDAARHLDRHGRLGPGADAGAAAACAARRLRPADAAAQRRRGDRLVLGLLLHHRRGDGWVFYVAMQTGVPAKLAANVAKLSPGFESIFSPVALAFAPPPRWRGSGW